MEKQVKDWVVVESRIAGAMTAMIGAAMLAACGGNGDAPPAEEPAAVAED